jgi:hypothetical protein
MYLSLSLFPTIEGIQMKQVMLGKKRERKEIFQTQAFALSLKRFQLFVASIQLLSFSLVFTTYN